MTSQSLHRRKPIARACRTYRGERRNAASGLSHSLVVLALAVSGCYRAPTVSGPNQVYDPNVEVTAVKDNEFETMSWPAVDIAMSSLVPDPENEPGCAVGIVRDDEILYLHGYGYARLPDGPDPGEKWGVATMGAVGSVSKTFTAAAAMRMHDLGLIDVNDQVEDYLATGNGPLGNARIYDLLGHSSGVGGDTQGEAFEPDWEAGTFVTDCIQNDPDTESAVCRALVQDLARPAMAFDYYESTEAVDDLGMAGNLKAGVYSNVGYSVLGAILDQVARDSTSSDGYEAFVWDEIGAWAGNFLDSGNMLSLALTHSWRDQDIPHRAVGYLGSGPDVLEAWDAAGSIEGWEGPSGGWAMTIGDLTRFMVALDNADFFDNANMLAVMRNQWTDLDGFDDDYGFGIFLGTGAASSPEYWHGGTIGPHNAVWAWWENFSGTGREVGVAMICNRSSAGVWTQKGLAGTIADIAAFGNPQRSPRIELQPFDQAEMQGLDGRVFELDTSAAWQKEPKRVIIPMAGLSRRLLLRPKVSNGRVTSFELAERPLIKREAMPSKRSLATLWTHHSSNPRFQTYPERVTLETALGALVVSDLEIEGAFSHRSETLQSVALRGTVDTRQLTGWASRFGKNPRKPLPSFAHICRLVEEAGSSCRPCADQVSACVDVRYEGLRGIAAAPPGAKSTREW